MCVTSPPYWGLRDYGTARWEGGEVECDHRESKPSRTANSKAISGLEGSKETCHASHVFGSLCGYCGARRIDSQLGLETSPDAYVAAMVGVFREVRRVLKPWGTAWLNLGDSYCGGGRGGNPEESSYRKQATNRGSLVPPTPVASGLKPKDMVGIPWRVALGLQSDGWYLRAAPPWIKASAMPESVGDRPTTAHETIFLLSKQERYFYDIEAVRKLHLPHSIARAESSAPRGHPKGWHTDAVPINGGDQESLAALNPSGRNRRTSDWFTESLPLAAAALRAEANYLDGAAERGGMLCDSEGLPLAFLVNSQSYPGAHFATFPEALVRPCILAGSSEAGVCPECGKPWERTVEGKKYEPDVVASGARFVDASRGDKVRKLNGKSDEWRESAASRSTLGFRPTCPHADLTPVPAIVLDPFAGSGTAISVATGLGRRGIGFDLSAAYLDLARRRVERPHARVPRTADAPLPLFP